MLKDDQTFSVSVDNVEGHLSSDGKFYVSADISGHTSGEVLSFNLSMAAYILTQEPQPDFTRPPRRGPTFLDEAKVHSAYLQERGRLATNKVAAGLPIRKAKRIIDDCV